MVARSMPPASCVSGHEPAFEWRVNAGRWRWLILSALGAAPSACGGRTEAAKTDPEGVNLGGEGGTQNSPGPLGYGGVLQTPRVTDAGVGNPGPDPVPSATVCANPVSLGGGWERCDSGLLHRSAVAGQCVSSVPRPGPVSTPLNVGAGALIQCRSDADCTAAAYGHCDWISEEVFGTFCSYGCTIDSDCTSEQVCLCGDPVGTCVAASCSTDADCGAGRMCADYISNPGCGGTAFACQTSTDECAVQSDCERSESVYEYCTLDGSGDGTRRVCSDALCVIGRPFMVDGCERLASSCARADWYLDSDAALGRGDIEASLDPALRAELARSWTRQALMEHASVAAFARFTLQLMSVGAPASLVQRSGAAMQDEIRHARSCFELARDYLAEEVGPGPLSLDGALEGSDLGSIVVNTIVEGCIGETVAAYEAAEARAHCEEPRARAVLERIAAEESQHAELAWQFVAWALATGPRELQAQVRGAFAAALAGKGSTSPEPSVFERELLRHGIVGSGLREALRARVLEQVIAPCALALLQPATAPDRSVSASWS